MIMKYGRHKWVGITDHS